MPVARILALSMAAAAVAFAGTAALAQVPSSDVAPGHADPYTNDPYITSSGATVPNPGKSQSGGTTAQDRAIRRQDNKIDKEICKGC